MENEPLSGEKKPLDRIFWFFECASQGNSSGLISCIEKGVAINEQNEDGQSGLHLAADKSRYGAVQTLLKAGANPNIQDHNGFTPLMLALAEARTDIADLLLEAGADVTLQNNEGKTCAHMMSRIWFSENTATPYIGKLVAHGLDINVTDNAGETPLMCATCYAPVETLMQMLTLGARIDCRDNQGDSLLHWSSALPDKVTFYLERGITPHERNFRLETPLHMAGSPEVVRILVDAGADLASSDNQRRSPLLSVLDKISWSKRGWVVEGRQVPAQDVVSAFLVNGADPDLPTKSGRTPRTAIEALCAGDTSAVASTHLVPALPEEAKKRQIAAQQAFLPLLQAHDAYQAVQTILRSRNAPGGPQ